MALVPAAATPLDSRRLHGVDVLLHTRRGGVTGVPCQAQVSKSQEMGWFEHGSTVIVIELPGLALAADVPSGAVGAHGAGADGAGLMAAITAAPALTRRLSLGGGFAGAQNIVCLRKS